MADYISREAAIEALRPYKVDPFKIGFLDDNTDGFNDGIDTAISELSVMPAADVRPVVHGAWVQSGKYPEYLECSACNRALVSKQPEESPVGYKFCPVCGAEMREETK